MLFACHVSVPAHLVEVEHQVQLADIAKECIEHLHEEMYRLQIRQLIVVRVYAGTEKQARISSVHDLRRVSEFDEVGLVLLIARGNEAMDLTRILSVTESGSEGDGSATSPFSLTFSSSFARVSEQADRRASEPLTLYGAYHFARRVLPLQDASQQSKLFGATRESDRSRAPRLTADSE